MKEGVELIENKEIRGLSWKTGVTILISTITIVISIATTFFLLKEEISKIRIEKIMDNKINDLRLGTIETDIKKLQVQYDNLRNDVNQNSDRIFKNK